MPWACVNEMENEMSKAGGEECLYRRDRPSMAQV